METNMNILFLTMGRFDSIEAHSIYADLLRCFRNHGHIVYTITPYEKKTGKKEIMGVLRDELNTYYQIDEYDFEKLQSQIQSWKQSYMDGDLEGMDKNAKKIEQNLEKNNSLQTILNQAQTIKKAQSFLNLKGSIDKLTPAEKNILDEI